MTIGSPALVMIIMRLGTIDGVATLQREGFEWTILGRTLTHEDVNVIVHQPGHSQTVLAGTYGHGLFHSRTGGMHWDRLPLPAEFIRAILFDSSNPNVVYAGTEPANLYRSSDGGGSWIDLQIRRVPGSERWSLPYSPRSGALRSIALHRAAPDLVVGAVEQGGVLVSTDWGLSWTLINEQVDPDVHTVALDPQNPKVFFAATGEGTFVSRDQGRSWTRLFSDYTRAIAIHPALPELMLAGPARDVGEGGRILVSRDNGKHWQPAERGLSTPLPDMVEHFVFHPAMPESVFAILSGGAVFISDIPEIHWRPLIPTIHSVQSLDLTVTA